MKTGPLAAAAKVSPETWWRWEKGRQKPREVEVVERFAYGFGLPIEQVMWAAGFVSEQPKLVERDPRLDGLDPADPIVRHIMSLEIEEETRAVMLNRRRQLLAQRHDQDIEEVQFWANRHHGREAA